MNDELESGLIDLTGISLSDLLGMDDIIAQHVRRLLQERADPNVQVASFEAAI